MRQMHMAAAVLFLVLVTNSVHAQDQAGEPGPRPPQDPILQLRLTPEQRQRIRAIREQNKEERAAINQRLRESNLALQQALDVYNPDEAVVEERLRDVAAAQAASMRIRVMTELSIRRVLTPEQHAVWQSLVHQANAGRSGDNPRRPAVNGLRPNQRNGLTPFPRRNAVPRNPRP
jgi:Spy/CpxP family protein refolding chaperone